MTDPIQNLIAAAKLANTWLGHFVGDAQTRCSPEVRDAIEGCMVQLRVAIAETEDLKEAGLWRGTAPKEASDGK